MSSHNRGFRSLRGRRLMCEGRATLRAHRRFKLVKGISARAALLLENLDLEAQGALYALGLSCRQLLCFPTSRAGQTDQPPRRYKAVACANARNAVQDHD